MSLRCSLFLALLLLPCPALHAQTDGRDTADEPIKMDPELALAIPWNLKGHDVGVSFPVLINRTTVLKPGMVLRSLYIPPNSKQSEDLAAAHLGNMAESFSRTTSESAGAAAMSSNDAHEIERQRRVVWEVPVNFQLAIAQLPTDMIHLIYEPAGNGLNVQDTNFDFFDGFILGSPTGKVTVLAVEKGSKADQAGMKAGDEIVKVGDTPMPDTLSAFPEIYVRERKEAQDDRKPGFVMQVRQAGKPDVRTLSLPLPPTIKSMLMEGFH